jgi:hypothetical protein
MDVSDHTNHRPPANVSSSDDASSILLCALSQLWRDCALCRTTLVSHLFQNLLHCIWLISLRTSFARPSSIDINVAVVEKGDDRAGACPDHQIVAH